MKDAAFMSIVPKQEDAKTKIVYMGERLKRNKMGMSIDEHIGVIKDLKDTMSVCMPEPEKTEICTSLSEAIKTMRKYKKIERILGEQGMPEWSYSKFKAIASIVRGNHDGNDN